MVIADEKSRKNIEAYVLLMPDARMCIDLLIETRDKVGVPSTNEYIFTRMHADTPMDGHTELKQLASSCTGLQFPDRISSRHLRKYTATVSQVSTVVSVYNVDITFQYCILRKNARGYQGKYVVHLM